MSHSHSGRFSFRPIGRALQITVYVILASLAFMQTRVPLGLLQGVAWTKMYLEYDETFNSSDSLYLVFSGAEVCGLCDTIDELRGMTEGVKVLAINFGHILLLPITEGMDFKLFKPDSECSQFTDTTGRQVTENTVPPIPPPREVSIV